MRRWAGLGLVCLLVLWGVVACRDGEGEQVTPMAVKTQPAGSLPTALPDEILPTAEPSPTPRPLNERETSSQAADWTVLVYMDADNDLEPAGLADLQEMIDAGYSDNVNVLIQLDRRADQSDGEGDWSEARRLRIAPGADGAVAEQVAALGEVNMSEAATLSDFIIWGVDNYPANHYGLVLWDHGAGWFGIAYDDTAPDTAGRDRLTLPELEMALTEATTATSVEYFDLIGFDGCLMGQLEVLATIAPFAEYAVGSEELTPGPGWNYTAWLGTLAGATGRSAAERAVETFTDTYSPQTNSFVTLSAVELRHLPQVTFAVEALAQQLAANPIFAASAVADARSGAESYAGFYGDKANYYAAIDLWHFANILAQRTLDAAIQESAEAVMAAVETAVIAEMHGLGLRNSRGIAIYFPRNGNFFTADYGQQAPLLAWSDFLQGYYATNISQASSPAVHIANNFNEIASLQNPAYIGFEVAGRGVDEVVMLAGLYTDNGQRQLLEYDPLIPEPTILPDGERLYTWRDGVP